MTSAKAETTDNVSWPRDFDFHAEVAEQQELLTTTKTSTHSLSEQESHDNNPEH